jgi:hypothetical protein
MLRMLVLCQASRVRCAQVDKLVAGGHSKGKQLQEELVDVEASMAAIVADGAVVWLKRCVAGEQ